MLDWIEKFADSKSKTFLMFCFSFLIGVGAASGLGWKINLVYCYFLLLFILSFTIFYWSSKIYRILFITTLFFILGLARYTFSIPEFNDAIVSYYNGRLLSLEGYVSAEPDVRIDGVKYIVQTRKILDTGKEIKGNVYINNALYPRYSYGDEIKFTCELKKPEAMDGDEKSFRYDMYLARLSSFSTCSYAKIEKIGEGGGSKILAGILRVKSRLADKITLLWHEPHASFIAGLLYGYRGGLGNLNDDFARTGITHIVAISGYNITIIATLFIFLLVGLRIRRQNAFWIITLGIILFVIFTGAGASVVRAGIMGILVLLAKQIGRAARAGNMMLLAAVIMVAQNPYVLLFDAGFQLSFISTLGLIYLSPVITNYFSKVPELYGLKESLISTLSAIIATLPLILHQFGRLSIAAPLVNILILWLIPYLMAGGAAAVLVGFIYLPLARILAMAVWLGLEYIIRVARWFAGLSFSAVEVKFPLWLTIACYCGIIYFVRIKKNLTAKNQN